VQENRGVRQIWRLPDEYRRTSAEARKSVELSGKPDAWKLARPVWGWGRGAVPRPTPLVGAASPPQQGFVPLARVLDTLIERDGDLVAAVACRRRAGVLRYHQRGRMLHQLSRQLR